MRRSLVGVVLVALLASQAHADDREKWQLLVSGSLMLVVGGGYIAYRGHAIVADGDQQLCDIGLGPPDCMADRPPPLGADIDVFEAVRKQQERGSLLMLLGVGVAVGSLGIASYSAYKWATFEPTVSIVPTVSKDGGGAHLMMRW